MKKPLERELIFVSNKGRLIAVELFKMDDNTYLAYAISGFDTDYEITGIGEAEEKDLAVKLAIYYLFIEMRKL